MKYAFQIFVLLVFGSCTKNEISSTKGPEVFVVVLGIAQDAGYPQANCTKSCCTKVWNEEVKREKVVSLGLVDRPNNKVYLFEATPDFKDQLHELLSYLPNGAINSVGGIFLTHAHIGHYTGLMQLGHEAMGAHNLPVYAMPRMKLYLEENGPWSQLTNFNNIEIKPLIADSTIELDSNIGITPFLIPHRDEYSETVGFKIESSNKSVLFIPDIDKWNKWDKRITEEIEQVDYAFLDATFYDIGELPGRNMNEIGHPFVSETLKLFNNIGNEEKNKIVLIHFNHTNPLLHNGAEYNLVKTKGINIAREGDIYVFD